MVDRNGMGRGQDLIETKLKLYCYKRCRMDQKISLVEKMKMATKKARVYNPVVLQRSQLERTLMAQRVEMMENLVESHSGCRLWNPLKIRYETKII